MSEQARGDWACIVVPGTLYEAQIGILDALSKYKGETAKIFEGKDPSGEAVCYVFVKT